ncbi:glycosyl hydrolase family 32 [Amycolatopsis antarctica]|uniref:Glycosyl hydrolase family 32 n=1 Tax=Amycolatopsis antarctica TaxID=1854586 RepID=A0A263D9I2_9PSEU|nr:glycosyl hydrolase family 32 [Amycolatopsis antarctica]
MTAPEASAGPPGPDGPARAEAGPVRHVYDPTPPGEPARYLNDHSVVLGSDGRWHLYSIVGDKAPPGEWPDYTKEVHFAHASAPGPEGPWTTHPYAMTVDPGYFGEEHLWAPHVVEHEGVYHMFYAAGGGPPGATATAINLATSTDMFTWTRIPSGPLFRDHLSARDPQVVRVGRTWVMYYTATETVHGGRHIVAYRTSQDLVHWGERRIAYADTETVQSHPDSNTESPFVVRRGEWWYLFIGPRGGYLGTDVYRSRNPLHFDESDAAGHLPVHAAEVVTDGDLQWVTGAGWTEDGLYLAELRWQDEPSG